MIFGNHCIKTYSQTQDAIAFSSGESGFYGIVKAAVMALGMKGLMEDLVVGVNVLAKADSSAAKSTTARRGAGWVRHIEIRELWVQDRVMKGELKTVKAKGEDHVEDGLAKHVDRQRMEQYVKACGIARRGGRHALSPPLGDSV